MNVNRYIFQSPYSSQIQIGRLESNASSDESSSNKNEEVSNNIQYTNKESSSFENMKIQESVKSVPKQNPDTLLDLYA